MTGRDVTEDDFLCCVGKVSEMDGVSMTQVRDDWITESGRELGRKRSIR